MLLCEVALGNMLELYTSFYVEKLPNGFNSVKAIGKMGGNWPTKTIVTPEGFQVPLGKEIETSEPTQEQFEKAESYMKGGDKKT